MRTRAPRWGHPVRSPAGAPPPAGSRSSARGTSLRYSLSQRKQSTKRDKAAPAESGAHAQARASVLLPSIRGDRQRGSPYPLPTSLLAAERDTVTPGQPPALSPRRAALQAPLLRAPPSLGVAILGVSTWPEPRSTAPDRGHPRRSPGPRASRSPRTLRARLGSPAPTFPGSVPSARPGTTRPGKLPGPPPS